MAAPFASMRLRMCQNLFVLRKKNYTTSSMKSSGLKMNHDVHLTDEVEDLLLKEELKAKNGPGIMKIKHIFPCELEASIEVLKTKYPVADLEKKSKKFSQYMWSRNLPVESEVLRQKAQELEEDVLQKENIDINSLNWEEREAKKSIIISKVVQALKKTTYHWKPVRYNAERSFLYLMSRATSDYCSLVQIFSEIGSRVPDFKPKTIFDFGSGLCTVTWAVNNIWKESIKEHYCVDQSSDMNTLAQLLLQGGEEDGDMCFPGVYFRQHFPGTGSADYDIVTSAHSLMELPNNEERLKTVLSLWRKTKQFLVLVENGTNAGFEAISEAREFVLQLGEEDPQLVGHTFSPCPHDHSCPRLTLRDGTPCNFPVKINTSKSKSNGPRMSYVVLRKGERSTVDSWPRLVRPPSNPSRRVQVRTCTPIGTLECTVITAKKHTKNLYRMCRASKWGDRLPITSPAWQQTDSMNEPSGSDGDVLDNDISNIAQSSDNSGTDNCHIDNEDASQKWDSEYTKYSPSSS